MLSSLKDMILILQCTWRHYQVKMKISITSLWVINSESNKKGHMGGYSKESGLLSQHAYRNMLLQVQEDT